MEKSQSEDLDRSNSAITETIRLAFVTYGPVASPSMWNSAGRLQPE